MAQRASKTEWDKENTTTISVKLNHKSDADLIEYISKFPHKSTALKNAARLSLVLDEAQTKAIVDAIFWSKSHKGREDAIMLDEITSEIVDIVAALNHVLDKCDKLAAFMEDSMEEAEKMAKGETES